jgi:hypothetical protein
MRDVEFVFFIHICPKLDDIEEIYLSVLGKVLDHIRLSALRVHIDRTPACFLAVSSLNNALMLPKRGLTHWTLRISAAWDHVAQFNSLPFSYRDHGNYK